MYTYQSTILNGFTTVAVFYNGIRVLQLQFDSNQASEEIVSIVKSAMEKVRANIEHQIRLNDQLKSAIG